MIEGMLKMMGVFAEMERNIISERVKSGLRHSKEKGVMIGRPKTDFEKIPEKFKKNYKLCLQGKISISDLARMQECSRTTVYKYIKILNNFK